MTIPPHYVMINHPYILYDPTKYSADFMAGASLEYFVGGNDNCSCSISNFYGANTYTFMAISSQLIRCFTITNGNINTITHNMIGFAGLSSFIYGLRSFKHAGSQYLHFYTNVFATPSADTYIFKLDPANIVVLTGSMALTTITSGTYINPGTDIGGGGISIGYIYKLGNFGPASPYQQVTFVDTTPDGKYMLFFAGGAYISTYLDCNSYNGNRIMEYKS